MLLAVCCLVNTLVMMALVGDLCKLMIVEKKSQALICAACTSLQANFAW